MKVVWMGWARADEENNGTKGENPDRKDLVDAIPITGGGDSPKPSLCDTEVALDICMGKAAEIKAKVGKGMEAYKNTSWGSTGIPTGAKVRAVGTWACIVVMGTTKETTWARNKDKGGCTWVMKGIDCWRSGDIFGIWEGGILLAAIGCCLFFGGESHNYFLTYLLNS